MDILPRVTHLPIGMDPPAYEIGPIGRLAISYIRWQLASRLPRQSWPRITLYVVDQEHAILRITDPYAGADLRLVMREIGARDLGPDAETPKASTILPESKISWWLELPQIKARLDAEEAGALAVEVAAAELDEPCVDCKQPIQEPAPGSFGRIPLCRGCWRTRVARGRQRQLEADRAWLERAA